MPTFKELQNLANELGYKTPALAMQAIGRANFMNKLKDNSIEAKIEISYKKVVEKPIRKKNDKKPVRKKPIGGKLFAFDEGYTIYPNGDVYSEFLGRLLSKIEEKSRHKVFLTASLRSKKYQVNRLVMFHFGNHSYKTMKEMPIVSPIDKDRFNNHIDNLEFVTQARVNEKYGLTIGETCKRSPKIPKSQIHKIKAYLLLGWSLKIIGNKYGVSPTSVARFIKRHKIPRPLNAIDNDFF